MEPAPLAPWLARGRARRSLVTPPAPGPRSLRRRARQGRRLEHDHPGGRAAPSREIPTWCPRRAAARPTTASRWQRPQAAGRRHDRPGDSCLPANVALLTPAPQQTPTQSSCGRTDAGWSCLQSRLAGGGVMRPPPSSGPWPAPGHLKRQLGCSALVARWSAQLTHAAMTAFASPLFRQAAGPELCNGTLPPLGTLLADLAHVPLAGASRLPSR